MNPPLVLFVDDEVKVLESFRRNLQTAGHSWRLEFISCPKEASDFIELTPPDVVVSDIRMPGISGFQLLEQIQANLRLKDTPVILVTGESDADLKQKALNLGATDLLNKPVRAEEVVARITSALRLRDYQNRLTQQNRELEDAVARRSAELQASRLEIIWRLARAAEFRDEDTGNHVIRVGCYSRMIAEQLGIQKKSIEDLFLAAPLHDIGKIGIPDAVLLKPGKLTDAEWTVMRRHCEIGESILREDTRMRRIWERWSETKCPEESNSALRMAASIARSHHEKWDGSGYPDGKVAAESPIEARIVAVADVFDALRSRRPYKEPMPIERALQIVRDGRETHFDPDANDAFFDVVEDILRVERELSDEPTGDISQLYRITEELTPQAQVPENV